MSAKRPQPRYGWHGQAHVIHTVGGVGVGDRVYHQRQPQLHGTVLSGPHDQGTYYTWTIQWDTGRTYNHTVETIFKVV